MKPKRAGRRLAAEPDLIAERAERINGRLYALLGPDAALTQLHDGQFIVVDPRDEQVSLEIIARGYWEVWIETAIHRMLKPGDRVIEVGANVGYHTLLMARRIGPKGILHTFEANPHIADLLRRSIALNGWTDRVRLHVQAATNVEGPVPFVTSRRQAGAGHILAGAGDFGPETVAFDAEGVTLDAAVKERQIDLLRLDAEGCEPLILAGALGILAYSPNLKICMEWDRVQMDARIPVKDFVDGLLGVGMKFWLIEKTATLSPLSPRDLLSLPHSEVVIARDQPF